MPSRLTAALAALLICAITPAPALAHHHPGYWDTSGDPSATDAWTPTDQPAEPTEPTEPVEPPQMPGPFPAPQPAPTVPQAPAFPTIAPTKTVAGKVAMLRTDGKAAVPRGAPKVVRTLIEAANRIVGKPYKWGGGHARVADTGYDCSGSVSYALIGSGLLAAPMVSGSFSHWDAAGAGRWITTYSTAGHVYMEVAGLRLDTSAVGDPGGRDGVRWRPPIGARNGFHLRHPAGL